jgi:hypothetical protein
LQDEKVQQADRRAHAMPPASKQVNISRGRAFSISSRSTAK